MTNTNFHVSNSDLSNYFYPRISGDPILSYNTNYTVNGNDIINLYYPYTNSSYANATGYRCNNSDLNTLFQNINDPFWRTVGNNGLSYTCSSLAIDSNNNLFVGGSFTSAGGVTANYIAKWDGSKWSSLGTGSNNGLNYSCYALAIDSNNNVYVGGGFEKAGGLNANFIAKWNPTTSTWSTLGSGLSAPCYALAIDSNNNVYAGGYFSIAGSHLNANRIAKWDPSTSTWYNLGTGLSDTCYALAIDSNNNVYAGGNFYYAGDVQENVNHIAKWDPSTSTWYDLESGLSSICYALAIDSSNNVYAGGSFTSAGVVISSNYIAKWNPSNSTWYNLGTGLSSVCEAIAIDINNNVYAGGLFTTTAGGVSVNYIAKWSPSTSTWSALGSGLTAKCIAIATRFNISVYAGGFFSSAGGVQANYIAKY